MSQDAVGPPLCSTLQTPTAISHPLPGKKPKQSRAIVTTLTLGTSPLLLATRRVHGQIMGMPLITNYMLTCTFLGMTLMLPHSAPLDTKILG